ncbi:hypothetical protein NKDENANG_00824 [Candidatus Entotheonellaceae bacterium PAL068K]
MPLLHRALLSGHKTGIHEWLLLTWYDAPRVRASLTAAARLGEISWQLYDLRDTDSARLDQALSSEDIIVISCTAVFDYGMLLALQECEGTVLCVTAASSATTDRISEGVILRHGQVVAMTATTPAAYHATGVLRCSGDLLGQALRRVGDAVPPDPFQLVLQKLIARTAVKALDVSQHLWIPLTAPFEASVAMAEAQLLRRLGREGDSWIVRKLDRPLSQALTKRLVRSAVRPNQMTCVSALVGLSGAFLLAQPAQAWQVLGSLMFLVSIILDGCDGEIARLTFQESAFGAKFDAVMDNVVHFFLFPGIALGLYRQRHDSLYLVLGAVVLGGVLVSMLVFLPYVLGQQQVHSRRTRIHESLASRDFAFVLPFLALFNRLHWFLWAAAVGTYLFAAVWVVLSWYERRWQRTTRLG